MNKLIVPFILALILTSSCSKKASEIADNTVTQSPTPEPTILNAKLPNFCEGHECPEGIVAVKTSDKSKTCAGIPKSTTEVLVSQNCLGEEVDLNIQTPDGLLIKVDSIEEEITNEFDDKVLKLNLSKELSTTSNISIPDEENKIVKLFNFNELGELNTQECELTYASLAYANSFNNESQLLNIKNCDGVKEGSLISQDGNVIGFLTKKNSEIELYEGISLSGTNNNYSLRDKIDEISVYSYSDDILVYSVLIQEYPSYEVNDTIQDVKINEDGQSITLETRCFRKKVDFVTTDSKYVLDFQNDILELNDDTKLIVENIHSIIPQKFIFKLAPDESSEIVDSEYYILYGDIRYAATLKVTEYIGDDPHGHYNPNNYVTVEKYLYIGESKSLKAYKIKWCK